MDTSLWKCVEKYLFDCWSIHLFDCLVDSIRDGWRLVVVAMYPLVHLLEHDDHDDNCDHDDNSDHDDLDEKLDQDDQDDHDTQPRVNKSMIDEYHDHILFTGMHIYT